MVKQIGRVAVIIGISFLNIFSVGCASKPELKQVSDSAVEKPINTPEKAVELIQKYSKS